MQSKHSTPGTRNAGGGGAGSFCCVSADSPQIWRSLEEPTTARYWREIKLSNFELPSEARGGTAKLNRTATKHHQSSL